MTKNVMKGNFKTLFKHFCLESTVLGLKYFYLYPDKITRCFWAVTLILTGTFACHLTLLLYFRFAETPTRVVIENQYESLETLPFPAVTICSPNQMTISSMNHFNKTLIDGNTTVNLASALPQLLGYYAPVQNINDEELNRLQKLIVENRYIVPEVMGLMPQDCDEFLKRCIFKMKVWRCRDLFRPVLTRHGLCCAFNSVYYFKDMRRNEKDLNFQPHMASVQGVKGGHHGLNIVVDYEPENALPKTLFHVGAIRIMFTDWTEFPADDQTSLVYPNVEAFLSIHGSHTFCSDEVANGMGPAVRQCLFDYERELPSFKSYRNSDCDHVCYMNAVQKACQCMPLYIPHVGTERACNVTKIRCINQVKVESNLPNSTTCNCPSDCDSRVYTVGLSIGNIDGLTHMTHNPYRGIKFNDSTTILQIFFSDSVYVKKKQDTVNSLISLASDLGGVFGLCVGLSVVSLMEVAFYSRKAIQNYLRKRLRSALQRRINNTSSNNSTRSP